MAFVIDASIAASWALDDEGHPVAELALQRIRSDEALAPILLWFELRNTLLVCERRKRTTEPHTKSFLRNLARLPLRLDSAPDSDEVMKVARKHRLTVYDSAYVELAIRESADLATLDSALAKAARAEGVKVLGD